MTKKEAIKAVKNAKKVFVYTVYGQHMGGYVKAEKTDVLATLKMLEIDEHEDVLNIMSTTENVYIG